MQNFYMSQAYEEALLAAQEDEVPIGAVVVDTTSGEIIAKAHNQSEYHGNAIDHAEIIVMREACQKKGTNRLRGMDLYVTLEPCTMCAAAISFMRIENLYIGALDIKGGGVINGVRFYDSPTCHHKPKITSGIMEYECGQILKDFFAKKRKKKIKLVKTSNR